MPPVAEAHDISIVAALVRTCSRFPRGSFSVSLDEVRCLGKCEAAVDQGSVHADGAYRNRLSGPPTNILNGSLTMWGRWRSRWASGMGVPVQPSRTHAGGCFLTGFILLGFFAGLSIRNPLKGVLIGTAVGAVLAVLTWLIDRRRRS